MKKLSSLSTSTTLKRATNKNNPKLSDAEIISSTRRTQASRRAEAEKRIVSAAIDIISRRGSSGMTLGDVGEAAGYSRGLPAHCFGSKEGLLRKVAEEINNHFQTLRVKQNREPGIDTVRGSIELYFSASEDGSRHSRAMLVMLSEALLDGSPIREEISKYNRQVIKGITGAIRISQDKGEVNKDLDAESAAILIMGALRGVLLQQILLESPSKPIKEILQQVIDYLLRPS